MIDVQKYATMYEMKMAMKQMNEKKKLKIFEQIQNEPEHGKFKFLHAM